MMHGPMSSSGDQRVQCLGAHVGFALAVELHVRLAAVGPVPQQDPIAALDQCLRQRPQTRDVLAEPAARRQRDEIAFLPRIS